MARGKHYGAAAEYARKKFGGDLVESESIVTVGTSAGDLITRNPERMFLLLINLGANPVYIRNSGEPANGSGLLLSASGGFVSFDAENDATMPAKGWRAIAITASSDVYVLQLRRETLTEEKSNEV